MMWPPLFVVVNYATQVIWTISKTLKFGSTLVPSTIFTSSGLSDLYSTMEGVGSMCLFLVPYLAYVITKGGPHAMVHLASQLNAPAQQGAGIASNEQASGNLSLFKSQKKPFFFAVYLKYTLKLQHNNNTILCI